MVDDDFPKVKQTLAFASASTFAEGNNHRRLSSSNSKSANEVPPLSMPMFLEEESGAVKKRPHDNMSSTAPPARQAGNGPCNRGFSSSPNNSTSHVSNRSGRSNGGMATSPVNLPVPISPDIKKSRVLSESMGYGSNEGPEEEATGVVEYWTRTLHSLPSSRHDSVQYVFISMLKFLVEEIRTTPPLQQLWTLLLVVSLLGGNVLQVIGLNFWLTKFPAEGAPGNYTIFAVSSLLFAIFFIVLLALYVFIHSPDLSFAWHGYGLKLLVLAGVLDALSSTLSIYSASHTPEMLQTLFTAFVPVYTAVLAKRFLHDARDYFNQWTIVSFSLIVAGVLLASLSHFWAAVAKKNGKENRDGEPSSAISGYEQVIWSTLFFLSVLPTVFLNITQTVYMKRYTNEEEEELGGEEGRFDVFGSPRRGHDEGSGEDDLEAAGSPGVSIAASTMAFSSHSGHSTTASPPPQRGEDTAVKLVMLSVDTTVQFLFALAFLPLDALPWFGGSRGIGQTWSNFLSGLQCVWREPGNLAFGGVYTAGFVLTYLAASYLNQRSVTLCAVVGQLTSPTTAMVLLFVPALNLGGEGASWGVSAVAVGLLAAGVLVYVAWEAQTRPARGRGGQGMAMPLLGRRRTEGGRGGGA
ncbi:unnamed protein product [Phytomonas sp. EM1]|nr:unnamed protein product [Phytomonas sp. EM1]|eukprot:CCW63985.1 unnamed protein product [Phytomonas sp. isolate EM1]